MKNGIYYLQYEDNILPLLNDDFVYWLELEALCEILDIGDPASILARLDTDQHRQISNSFGGVYPFVSMDVVYELILDQARKRRTRGFRQWLGESLSTTGPNSFTRRTWFTFGTPDTAPTTTDGPDRRPAAAVEDGERFGRRPALSEEPQMTASMEGRRSMSLSEFVKDPALYAPVKHAGDLLAVARDRVDGDELNEVVGLYSRLVSVSPGGVRGGGLIGWDVLHSMVRDMVPVVALAEAGLLLIGIRGVAVLGVDALEEGAVFDDQTKVVTFTQKKPSS